MWEQLKITPGNIFPLMKNGIRQFLQNRYEGPAERTGKRLSLQHGADLWPEAGAEPLEKFMLLGYDEVYAIQYFGKTCAPGGIRTAAKYSAC